MELRDYLRVLRAHWVGVLVLTVVGVALAFGYTLTQPKVYAADASGFVTAGAASDPGQASVYDSLAKSRAASYVDLATSRTVAQLVIDDLGLDTSPASLVGSITVTQPIDTVLIKINATSSSPEEAQRLADAWVKALATRVAQIENPDDVQSSGILGIEPSESAALPGAPVSPRPAVNLAAGAFLGLVLGLGYAIVRSRFDRRLRDPGAVEKAFGVSIIGSVPVAKNTHLERADMSIVFGQEHSQWGAGEAFRKLRTNLAYMNVDSPPRVIIVTSPRPAEGKSTVAANLACAIALSGQPVTLVDGDLRRPTVAENLGLIEGAGLTDVLIGSADVGEVLQQHAELPGLSVLAAGSVPPNPSELLGSQAMRNLLAQLGERSMVVVDAPPLLPVTDAAVLTRHSDGAIVVISHGSTLDGELADTLRQLRAVQATILGVVFNRTPRKNNSYGGYYGEYYSRATSEAPSRSKGRKPAKAPKTSRQPEPVTKGKRRAS